MQNILKKIFIAFYGFVKQNTIGALRYLRFYQQFRHVSPYIGDNRLSCSWADRYPCLNDATADTGFDPHYLYHTAWAARVLARMRPKKHVDFSSCLRFCSMVSAFIPIDFYDYRPAWLSLDGLENRHADLTHLPFTDGSLSSVSCMHVVEHIGLGRYGDPIDAQGDLKAMHELARVLAPGGHLLFVVPIGLPRIAFNAHRIYDPEKIQEYFPNMLLAEFAFVDDAGRFHPKTEPKYAKKQHYGCGCFHFTAPSDAWMDSSC